jgi:hypothetical protein
MFMPSEFMPSEAMMKEHPRRGLAFKNCIKLQFRIDSLSFKENAERSYSANATGLGGKKWIASHLVNKYLR